MGQGQVGVARRLYRAVEVWRRQNDVTKEQFALRAGIGRQTLDRLQDGKQAPRLKTVHKIADVIGMEHEEAEVLAGYERLPREGDVVDDVEQAGQPEVEEESDAEPRSRQVDAREAILHDPRLDDHSRRLLLGAFDAIVAGFEGRGAPPALDTGHDRIVRRRAS